MKSIALLVSELRETNALTQARVCINVFGQNNATCG